MGTDQDYSKTGFAENTNTLGLNVCTQSMRIIYENDFTWGHIKITQILDSQKIITLGLNICTQIKRLRIKFVYSVGTIQITQNLDSQQIKLHGASILVLRA